MAIVPCELVIPVADYFWNELRLHGWQHQAEQRANRPAGCCCNPDPETAIGGAGAPRVEQYQYQDKVCNNTDDDDGGGVEFHVYIR